MRGVRERGNSGNGPQPPGAGLSVPGGVVLIRSLNSVAEIIYKLYFNTDTCNKINNLTKKTSTYEWYKILSEYNDLRVEKQKTMKINY